MEDPRRIFEKGTDGPLFCLSALIFCSRLDEVGTRPPLAVWPPRLLGGDRLTFARRHATRQAPAATRPAHRAPRTPAPDDYLGSRACARCHETSNDQWERSLHIRMTKPIAEATVVGDFSDGRASPITAASYEFGTHGRQAVHPQSRSASRAPETFPVDYTLGFKRYQGYLSTLADGRIYVLPAFWHIESQRWMDWKEITPIPDGAHDLRQIWNINCFNCHATNLVAGLRRRRRSATTRRGPRWASAARRVMVPGREHVALMDAWEKNPATQAGVRQQRQEPRAERDAEDLLAAHRGAAPDLRHVRLLPRQQDEHVHRVPRRRSLRGLRAAVPHQRADSRERLPGRVLARRPAEPLQSSAGA